MFDFGARHYDPVIGRWMGIDPLARLSVEQAPYNYAENNPLNIIDLDGMQANPHGSFGGVPQGGIIPGSSWGSAGDWAGAGLSAGVGLYNAWSAFSFKNPTHLNMNFQGVQTNPFSVGASTMLSRTLTNDNLNQALQSVKDEANQIFSGDMSFDGHYLGGSVGLKVGPLTLKAEGGVLNGKAQIDHRGTINLEGSLVKAGGEAGFGSNIAKGDLEFVKGTIESQSFGHNPIKFDLKAFDKSGKAVRGKLTLENSLDLGLSGGVASLKLEGKLSFYHLGLMLMNFGTATNVFITQEINHLIPVN